MVTIPPRFLDEIRDRLTLSEIIGQRIKVTRAGREFKACCPFHNEKSPSFTINDQKQFYHCFGCGAHGDVIGFTMQYNNLSFIDAVKSLSAQAGMQMPNPDPEAIKRAEKQRDLYSLMDEATAFFMGALTGDYLKYLTDRGLTKDTIEKFRIGFAPVDGQALRKHLASKKYTDAQMMEAGVLKASTRGGEPYVFFRERIMFPVADRRGRVVAFGGRVLPDHMRVPSRGDFTPPKYINSAETPIFDKGRMLYGESLARQAVRDGKTLLVTEGYMDVIACHQAGFSGAVAPMGTALTEDQILSLWSMIPDDHKVPVLCFDGDNAGQRAAGRACERIMPLLKPGQSAGFAFLSDGEDPDSIIRAKGAEGFKAIIQANMPLVDYVWASYTVGKDFNTPEARAGVTDAVMNAINAIGDKSVQSHYRRAIQDKISATFFPKRGGGSFKGKGGRGRSGAKPPRAGLKIRKPAGNKKRLQDMIVLATILNYPAILEQCEDVLSAYEMSSPDLLNLYQTLTMRLGDDPDLDSDALKSHLNEQGFEQLVRDICRESVYVHASFCAIRDDSADVQIRFTNWMKEIETRNWDEIKQGWRAAFSELDENYEEKLREMVKLKTTNKN